jgi:hypothetical protein
MNSLPAISSDSAGRFGTSAPPAPWPESKAPIAVPGLSPVQASLLAGALERFVTGGEPPTPQLPEALWAPLLGQPLAEHTGLVLSDEQHRLLGLYVESIPAVDRQASSLVVRFRRQCYFVSQVRTPWGEVYHPLRLLLRRSFGREARSLDGKYRYGELPESERVKDAGRYTRAGRRRFVQEHSLRGLLTPGRVAFTLPAIGDRPLRVAFVSLFPKQAHILIHSVGANYVHSYLEQACGSARLRVVNLDLQLISLAEMGQQLAEFEPDLIGISTKTNSHELLADCMRHFQENHRHALIVLGGTLATFAWRELLEEYPQALLVLDNGEFPLAEIVRVVLGQKAFAQLAEIPNLAFNLDGAAALTPYRDISMAHHFLPAEANVAEVARRDGIVALRWSEGCWGNCTFCSLPPKWKGASAEDILFVLKRWRAKFGIRSLFFTDDEVVPKEPDRAYRRLEEFADQMIEADLGITWTVSLRADCIHWMDRPLAQKLKQAGCQSFFIGVESGSDSQLRRYGKLAPGMLINAEVNARALRFFRDQGITIGVGWIPFDPAMATLRELRENLRFVLDNDLVNYNARLDNALRLQKGAADVGILGQLGLDLVGELQPNLLFYDSTYLDPRVGTIKDHVQVWMENMKELDGRIHRARFHAAVDPAHADHGLVELGKRLQGLTTRYLQALLAEFPETEEDHILDGAALATDEVRPPRAHSLPLVDQADSCRGDAHRPVSSAREATAAARQRAVALLKNRDYLRDRRNRLIQVVWHQSPRLQELTSRFMRERNRLLGEAGLDLGCDPGALSGGGHPHC